MDDADDDVMPQRLPMRPGTLRAVLIAEGIITPGERPALGGALLDAWLERYPCLTIEPREVSNGTRSR
jgi:hypothetical protein